jgi:lipopolysaccharide transport system ATP-binding protein
MTVRLGFAIAAHLEPEILVVDEVLAVGDAEFQKKAIGKMQDVSTNDGRTVLFVSHNMASVRRLCQRGMLLNNGTVQETGDIEQIVNLYIKGNSETKTRSRTWPNNTNKSISINRIQVLADNKNESDVLDIKDKIEVKIDYQVNQEINNSNISFGLYKEGVLLFRTWDIDSNIEDYGLRKPGIYSATLILPDFLQPGNYTIYAASGQPGIGGIDVKEEALTFELENVTTEAQHKSFIRGGFIRAQINWKTEKIQ